MAQIIKHRRGSIDSLKGSLARKGELVIATGSIGNMNGPWVFVGDSDANGAYKPTSQIYRGNDVPTISNLTYGSTLDGTPFYSITSKSLFILDSTGNAKIDLTGNIEGNTISGVTINDLQATNVTASFVTGAFIGDASGLYNLSLTGITGLELNKITSGSATASISPDYGLEVNVDVKTTSNLYVTGTIHVGDDTSSQIYNDGDLYIEDDTNGVVILSNNGFVQLESSGSYVWVENGEAYVEGNTFTNIYTNSGSVVISSYQNGILELNTDGGEGDVNVLNGTNKINIHGNSNFTGSVNISGNTSITGALVVSSGSATFDQGLVAENSNMLLTSGSNLIIQDGGNIHVAGDVYITGSEYVDFIYGKTDTNNYLAFNGGAVGAPDVELNSIGNISLWAEGGPVNVTGSIKVTGDVTVEQDLYVSGNIYQTGSFYTQGSIILSGSINLGDFTGDTVNFTGEVNSNILPTTGATYDLGSSGQTWNNVWGETAHFTTLNLGSIELNSLALPGDLTVSGSTTLSGSVAVSSLTEGRIVTVGTNGSLVDSNAFNWDSGSAQLGISGSIKLNNSANIYNDYNDGALYIEDMTQGVYIQSSNNHLNLADNGYANLYANNGIDIEANGPLWLWSNDNNVNISSYDGNSLNLNTDGGEGDVNVLNNTNDLYINSLSGSWSFKKEGDVSFPILPINERTGTGEGLVFKKSAYQKVIATEGGTNLENTVERMVIAGGDSYYSGSTYYGEGGDLYLWAGKGNNGGDVKVDGGEATDGLGGTVKVRGGYSENGNGGFVEITAGDSSNALGGNVVINVGNGDTNGVVIINGDTLLTGSLYTTHIIGTGSLYLQPDQNDGRRFEIYNTGATGYTDVHLLGNADLNFFGDDTNYLKIDDNAQTVSIVGVNGVFISSSLSVADTTNLNGALNVTGATTLYSATTINASLTVTGNTQVQGNTSITGAFTVGSGSMTSLGGDLYVSGNLEVLGSSTNVNIQSQTVNIGDNIIQVNAYSPFDRYAGLSAYDSGSSGESGSLLWDSVNDYWLLVNSNSYSSKVIGTTASTGGTGTEISLTSGTFPIATESNTIGDSLLTFSGTTLALNTNKFTIDSETGDTLIYGNFTIQGTGATDNGSYLSYIVFKNSDDTLGFVGSSDTTNETDRLLGYNSSSGVLEFSSLIDGGTY
jgi:hypothetical protein